MSESNFTLQAFVQVLNEGLNFVRGFLPTVLGALVVVLAGWILSRFAAMAIARTLRFVGFEKITEKSGVNRFLQRAGSEWNGSHAVGELCKWVLRLMTIQIAASILNMPQINEVIQNVIMFTPRLFVALVIMASGMMFGNFLSKAVRGSATEMGLSNPNFLSGLVYYSVLGFSVIATLSHLEIAPAIINSLFIGLVSMVGLAFGLAFGLGGKEVAAEITREWYEKAKQTAAKQGGHSSTGDRTNKNAA